MPSSASEMYSRVPTTGARRWWRRSSEARVRAGVVRDRGWGGTQGWRSGALRGQDLARELLGRHAYHRQGGQMIAGGELHAVLLLESDPPGSQPPFRGHVSVGIRRRRVARSGRARVRACRPDAADTCASGCPTHLRHIRFNQSGSTPLPERRLGHTGGPGAFSVSLVVWPRQPGKSSGRFSARCPWSAPVAWPTSIM